MAVRSVQFTTADQVLAAYKSRAVPDFTIYQDKQYLFKYDGADLEAGEDYLSELLAHLCNSAAIYTLKVYEDGHDKINDKTAHDGSFNFRFQEVPVYSTPGHGAINGIGKISEEIALLRSELQELRESGNEGERNDDDNGVMGMVNQVLSHPAIMPLIPVLVNKLFADKPAAPAVPAVAGPGMSVGQLNRVSGLPAADKKRIDQALTILSDQVADLPAVLEKLAWLSQNNKPMFDMALNMLHGMK